MLFSQTYGNYPKCIIFIHGNSQSQTIWGEVIQNKELANKFTLVTVDLPGHGQSVRSTEPERDYSLNGMANALREFIERIHDKEYLIVCHSLGTNLLGEIAGSLLNCRGIFLIGADIIGENFTTADIFKPNPNTQALFTENPGQDMLDALINDQVENITNEQRQSLEQMYRQADPVVRTCLFNSIIKQEWTDEIKALRETSLPLAFVYGKNEKLCITDYLDKSLIPKWKNEIILIPDSGHCVHLDSPSAIINLIREFSVECFKSDVV